MIASFGAKTFEASYQKIMTPSDISVSEKLSYEEQARSGDKPAIYVKGLGAMSIEMSVRLDARFVDVAQEITFWMVKLRAASPEKLTIGSQVWGSWKALLTEVSADDIAVLGNGVYSAATVKLSFVEYVAEGTSDDGEKSVTGATMKAARIMLNETLVNG